MNGKEGRDASGPQGGSPASGAVERWAFVALCGFVLVYWAFQYQPFVLPNNDYHSFERTARAFGAFEWPSSFKRMPILPALMALIAPFLPEPHAYLHAALVWNQIFSIGVLVGLFVLGQRLLGGPGLLLPVLFTATTQFHGNGLQPLVEPSLGFFVVWAFVMQERGSAWQYAFAAGAALSRYEAALLIPALWAAEVIVDRRFWIPVAKAIAAGTPLLAWTAIGSLQGSGGGSYMDLMSGMGFQPAPGFFLRSVKEPFGGWYTSNVVWLVPFAGVVLVPLVVGAVRGLRERTALAGSMLGFGVGCVVAIVVFGINKARYVYPTEWIWQLFWLWGALRLAPWVVDELRERAPGFERVATFGALGLALLAAAFWVRKMSGVPQTAPLALEFAFLAAVFAVAGVAIRPRAATQGSVLAAAGLLVALVPLLAGGLVGKQRTVHKVYYSNWSAHRLAGWLEQNLGPDDRVVLLPRSHIQHLTALPKRQLLTYSDLEAEDLEGLRDELVERAVSHVVFTDRGPLRNPSHHHYYREKKTYLSELFETGEAVPGFEHVATLDLPAHIPRKPVQIYRRRPEAP